MHIKEEERATALRNGKLMVAARGGSDFGSFLNMVALSTYIYFLSNDVFHVSLFLACRVAGGLIASLVGTPFYLRYVGRFSLVGFDLLRALFISALLILPTSLHLQILPFMALAIGFSGAMFSIGLNSQLPKLVPEDQLISINAWISSASAMGAVMGSLVSGVLIALGSYELVFIVNLLTYLGAACLVLGLKTIHLAANGSEKPHKESDWRAVFLGLKRSPVLAGMLLVTLADTLGSAAHNVGFPILSKLISPDDASTSMGLLLATWALGKFLGANVCGKFLFKRSLVWMDRLFFLGVACMSLGFIATFQQLTLLPALVFIIVAGIGDGLAEVCLISRVQKEPEVLRLPLFSVLNLFQMTGFGIGMLIVAPFYVWYEPSVVIILFHGFPLIMLFITGILGYKLNRAISV
jgi:hypothetical protein